MGRRIVFLIKCKGYGSREVMYDKRWLFKNKLLRKLVMSKTILN